MSGPLQKFRDWVMVRHLGRGTYGEVTLWRHEKTNQQVAVKKCPLFMSDPEEKRHKMKERWNKELSIMQGEIKNEYIVSAVHVDSQFLAALHNPQSSILPPLVMEYCDGGDLRSLLYNIKNSNGLTEIEVKNVLRTLCGAIRYLHSHDITHRDLKPENIVIKKGEDGHIFKVTDFGYAKDIIHTDINSQVGTIGYFAPEIILEGKYSKTVDFWSMGIVTFEIICGINPFIPHQKIKTWMEQIRWKSQEIIAITETKDNEFQQHNRIFDENQITSLFRGRIETWLKIALNINPKRGCRPERCGAPDEVQNDFFMGLESILSKKILTIFCLTTYTFLDYEVTEQMSIRELLRQIERDTNIPVDKIHIILTPHHGINQITSNTRVIDLIVDNIDGPMLYVCGVPRYFLDNEKLMMVETPKAIADALDSTNQAFKMFYILELARKMLFLARNENRHFVELLKGLKMYAMILNHHICSFERVIGGINENKILGASENYFCLLNHSKQLLQEKKITHVDFLSTWETKENKFRQDIPRLVDACERLRNRYRSVLRRSKEIIDFPLLKDTDKDFFNVKAREELYSILRDERKNAFHECGSDKIHNLVNVYYEICQKRSKLLEDSLVRKVQEDLADVHEEYCIIQRITNDACCEIEKKFHEIQRVTCEHIDDIWKIMEQTADGCKNIPDLDSMMSSLKMDDIQNGAPSLSFQFGFIQPSQMDVCSLIDIDTKSLVEENENLTQSLQTTRVDFPFTSSAESSRP